MGLKRKKQWQNIIVASSFLDCISFIFNEEQNMKIYASIVLSVCLVKHGLDNYLLISRSVLVKPWTMIRVSKNYVT